MIQKVDCYTAECNICKKQYECHEGWALFVDDSSVKDHMLDDEWHVDGENCYCPNCHEVNDDDELIIKQPL